MSIIAVLISNPTPPQLLFQYSTSILKINLAADSSSILSLSDSLGLDVGQRQRLNADYGVWFITKDDQSLVYAACVSYDYPQRVIFGLFHTMQIQIKQKSHGRQFSKVIKGLNKKFNALCQEYKDARLEKVLQIQAEPKELNKELKSVVQNQGNVNNLKSKNQLPKNCSQKLEKGSRQALNQTFWEKWKILIMLGILIGNILIVSGILIYFKVH